MLASTKRLPMPLRTVMTGTKAFDGLRFLASFTKLRLQVPAAEYWFRER